MSTYRSDLALETAENLSDGKKFFSLPGVKTAQIWRDGYEMTDMVVINKRGEEALGKPMGHYVTLDLRPYFNREANFFQRAVRCFSRELRQMLPEKESGTTLVVGLGNHALAADSVGPLSTENLLVTRHMVENHSRGFRDFSSVCAICPGVVAATGIETCELVESVVKAVKPQTVVCIDALCANTRSRLCATIQLGNTGIVPGSGVGNHREPLNQESLGIPVIAIGVPTVINSSSLPGADSDPLFVTPGDIDSRVRELSRIVGYSINLALHPQITMDDIAGLLG